MGQYPLLTESKRGFEYTSTCFLPTPQGYVYYVETLSNGLMATPMQYSSKIMCPCVRSPVHGTL